MKVQYLKLKHWLLATLLGALGFSACQSSRKAAEPEPANEPLPRGREEIRAMYGVPTMDYTVRGYVRNPKGKPVSNIEVNLLERGLAATPDTIYGDPENVRQYLEETSVRTNKEGHFEVQCSDLPQQRLRLLVRDTDGKRNGAYRNQIVEINIDPNDINRSHAGGWNQGSYNHEVSVQLEEQ